LQKKVPRDDSVGRTLPTGSWITISRKKNPHAEEDGSQTAVVKWGIPHGREGGQNIPLTPKRIPLTTSGRV